MQEHQPIQHGIQPLPHDLEGPINMKSKFFTLATSTLLLTAGVVVAQSQSPAPKVGYIRFWNMLPTQNGTFEVRRLSGPGSEQSLGSATSYRYTSYRDIPIGRYKVAVQKVGTEVPL